MYAYFFYDYISHIFIVVSAEPDNNIFYLNEFKLKDNTESVWLPSLNIYYLWKFFTFLPFLPIYYFYNYIYSYSSNSPPKIILGSMAFNTSKFHISISGKNVPTIMKLPALAFSP